MKSKLVKKFVSILVCAIVIAGNNIIMFPDYAVSAEVVEDVSNLGDIHTSSGGVSTKDNGMMRKDLTAHQLIKLMGQGWNLANTMESYGGTGTTVIEYEGLWGAPRTTQSIIDGIKASGFRSIRIPVAWSNMMSTDGNYTINESFMKRVEVIVNYCLNNEMYVVLNIHYDGGWWGMFGSADKNVQEQAWKKYESIWQQIATRFNEYSDHLIFESANEELGDGANVYGGGNLGLNTAMDGVKGTLTLNEIYEKVNAINQKFVEVVRNTGGNNSYRHLLIAGFSADIDKTCDDRFKMPVDTVNANGTEKLHVSIHYYSPTAYCINEDASDSHYLDSWGTEEQVNEMHASLDKMAKFTDKGYGVIIGEYGPQSMEKKGVVDFYRELMTYGPAHHMAPMVWNLSMYDRVDKVIAYSDIADLLEEITGAQNVPLEEGADITGKPFLEIMDEDTLEKVAEWSGKWTRTNNQSQNVNGQPVRGDKEVGNFEPGISGDGMEVRSNAFWWQFFVKYDWTKLVKPCIKVTMASDDVSKDAAFQIGYGSDNGEKDPQFTKTDEYDKATYAGKTFTLKQTKLAVKPWICLTTQTEGASIVKVEIYEGKYGTSVTASPSPTAQSTETPLPTTTPIITSTVRPSNTPSASQIPISSPQPSPASSVSQMPTSSPQSSPAPSVSPTAGISIMPSATPAVKKQMQYIIANSYVKTYGSKPFYLNAKTSGNGRFSYEGTNKKVAVVSQSGKISIKGYGKTAVTITASGTDAYYSAVKKISITVIPKKASIQKLTSKKKGGIICKVKKQKKVSGYEFAVTDSKDIQKTIKKQKPVFKARYISRKKYCLKVRAYKKIGKKVYRGAWSKKRIIKTK